MVVALVVSLVGISVGVLFGAAHLLDRNNQQPGTPKRVRTLSLPGRPMSIVSGAHAIWISTEIGHQSGQVTRIDPASTRVWRYDLGAVVGGMQITAGRGGVFVVKNENSGTIAQLDPHSPAVIREFSGRKYRRLLVGGGSLWAGGCGGSVIRIDPLTLHETATIPVIHGPGPPAFKCQDPVLFAQHALWVLTGQHRLSRLDPETQTITQSIHVPFAYTEGSWQNVATSPGRIWATYSNSLDGRIRIEGADTRTGRVIVSRRVGRAVSSPNDLTAMGGQIRAIAANSRYLWLAVPGRVLWLDPSTLRAVRTTRVTDPTGLTIVDNSLWVLEGRRGSGGAVQRISIGGGDTRPTTSASAPAPFTKGTAQVDRQDGIFLLTRPVWSFLEHPSGPVEPRTVVAIASYPVERGGRCSPTKALDALPPDGALAWLTEYSSTQANDFPPRPTRFSLDPSSLANYKCSASHATYMFRFQDHGRLFQVHVAFGEHANRTVRDEMLASLSSLVVDRCPPAKPPVRVSKSGTLTPDRGRVGERISLSGPTGRDEDWFWSPLDRIKVWWSRAPIGVRPQNAEQRALATVTPGTACSFRVHFQVPSVPPGRYLVSVLGYSSDGYGVMGQRRFTVLP
jgi:hypothetical protein